MKKEKSMIVMKKTVEIPCGPKEYYEWAKEYVEIVGKNIATLRVRIAVIENYHLPNCTMEILDPKDKDGLKKITVPDRQMIAQWESAKQDALKQIAEFNYIYGLALEKIEQWEKKGKKEKDVSK